MRSISSPSSFSSTSRNSAPSDAHLDLSGECLAPAVCRTSPTPACSAPLRLPQIGRNHFEVSNPFRHRNSMATAPPGRPSGRLVGPTFATTQRLSLMTSGRGARWAAREFDREAQNGCFRFPDWSAFSEEFQEGFLPLHFEAIAANALEAV